MELEAGCIPAFESSPMKVLGRQMPAFEDIPSKGTKELTDDESELSGIGIQNLQPALKQTNGGSPIKGRPGSPARDLTSDETIGRRDWMPPPSPPASPPPESEVEELQESDIEAAADYDELVNEKQSLLSQVIELTESNEILSLNNSLLTQKAEGLAAALDAEKQLNSHNSPPPSRTHLERSIHAEYKQQIEQLKATISKLSIDLKESLSREASMSEAATSADHLSLRCEELTTKVDELRAQTATKDATISELRLELLRREQVEQSQKAALARLRVEKIELVKTLRQVGGKATNPTPEKASPTRADLQQLLEAGEELSRANRDAEKKLAPSTSVTVTVPQQQPPATRTSVPLTFNCSSPSTQSVLSDTRSPSIVVKNIPSRKERTPSPNKSEVRFTAQHRTIIPPGHPYAPRE
eukprot:TRINITY_DN22322_c0_g1_i1.p1 TRINITY_DN22322_c0_g1~~TRINITY_DN22322_c0_g1_i1.p1  ORF type:complete len:413 (+),score=94.34 TRINITY_DN22322_c0_g1_i1:71-1309(+)